MKTKLHSAVLSSITTLKFGIDDLRAQRILTEPLRVATLNEADTHEMTTGLSARLAEAERRLDHTSTRGKQMRTLQSIADDLHQTIEGVRKNYVTAHNGAGTHAESMISQRAAGRTDFDKFAEAAKAKGGHATPGDALKRGADDGYAGITG